MPITTPGTKKGSHEINRRDAMDAEMARWLVFSAFIASLRLKNLADVASASAMTTLAATAANQNEFQIEFMPASTAPASSTHVRFANAICANGKPTATAHNASATKPQPQNQPAPS